MNFQNIDPLSRKRHAEKVNVTGRIDPQVIESETFDCNIEHLPAVTYPDIVNEVDIARKFYLKGDMMNLYPYIRAPLERSFSELFFSDVSLLNENKFTVFKILLGRILIISCKLLIMTVISNKKQMN